MKGRPHCVCHGIDVMQDRSAGNPGTIEGEMACNVLSIRDRYSSRLYCYLVVKCCDAAIVQCGGLDADQQDCTLHCVLQFVSGEDRVDRPFALIFLHPNTNNRCRGWRKNGLRDHC